MLALQAANNETGVIQPVAAAAELIHAVGGFLVCDAVQAAGRIDCDIESLGADAIVLSAHKFGGPKGAGAVCFRSDSTHIREALLRGGGQERGLRAGTENVAGIAGMAAASLRRGGPAVGGGCGPLPLARRAGGKYFAGCARRGVFWRRGGKVAEYVLLRRAQHRGASVAYGFGFGGYCGIVGFRLFIGEGETFACLARDGRGAGCSKRRDQG